MGWHLHKWKEVRGDSEVAKQVDYGSGRYVMIVEYVRYFRCSVCGKEKRRVDFTQQRTRT